MLDMKTTMVGFILSTGLQAIIVTVLWRQHGSQFRGLNLWVLAYLSIFIGFCSIVFFNLTTLPSLIVLINAFSLGGLIILVFGLEQFFEITKSWRINLLLFIIVMILTVNFTYINPGLKGRLINTALGNFIIWIQTAWLVFYRIKPSFRNIGRQVGIISLLLAITTLFRVSVNLNFDPGLDFFRTPDLIIWSFLAAQILFFGFTFSLILMVSRRLNSNLEHDIKKRKQTEEKLRETEKRLSGFYIASFEGIVLIEQGKIIDHNHQCAEMLGYENDELIGKEVIELVAEEDRELVLKNIRSDYEKPYDHKALKKDGSIIYVEVRGLKIQFEGRQARVTVIRDLTEKKITEKALQDSERNMASVLNNTQDAVVRIDRSHRHIFANPSLYATTGLSPEQYLKKTDEEIGMPEELCAFRREKHEKVFQSGEPEIFEFSFSTANKGERVFQAVVSPEFNDDNEVETIVSFMRDISEIKKEESEKNAVIDRLEQALTEVKTLRGFLPICANCKKIRDDEGYWERIEKYIMDRTDAQFSHSICPECTKKLYPEYYKVD